MCNNLEKTTATQITEKQNCREAMRLRAKDLYSCRRNDGGRVVNSTLRGAMARRFVGSPKALAHFDVKIPEEIWSSQVRLKP